MEADAQNLLFLLTPQHTGTHFARLLLECHSEIAFCITESRRIDEAERPNYRLAGNGDGPSGPPHERMLDEYITAYFHGRLAAAEFVRRLRFCMSQRSEAFGDQTIYEHVERAATSDLARIGIRLPPKRPRYLFFQGHCGPKYQHAALDRGEFRLVVTLRHPLLAVISALRRAPNPAGAQNILTAFDIALRLRQAFFLCTDLWQPQAARFLDVFSQLQIPVEDAARQYVSLAPSVNQTVPRNGGPLSSFEECESDAVDNQRLATLREAKELLVSRGLVHACLDPWWQRVRELQLHRRMRTLGYDF